MAHTRFMLDQTWRQMTRLARLGLHIGEGFALGTASGALFFPHQRFQQPVVKFWHKRFCQVLGIDITVHGKPDPRPALWVSNHISWLDIPVIGAHFPVHFLSKAEVQTWPVIGRLAKAGGTLYIKRGSGDSNSVSEQMAAHLQAGRSVLFFPEGTTTDGKELKRFFHKLFKAACVTGTDIQPVVLCYRDETGSLHPVAPFIGDDAFADHLLKVLKEKKIQVELLILPRVSINGRDERTLARDLRQMMTTALQHLQAGIDL
ncbi:lysophospholipid acyltransferase family protein [Agitococcus lubricus]|uniref:1-acyl-sn-glycerol-3-phosphate acyltransferase n=1 Tax=Agitococcus lubricus TaxID=1077255 RepID=A0A2T5IYW8_9GAMM|nr:lysophospholipid acyltransferase family protein [Agitococcus lubricus]PTQ89207.1 1-acyl-sn-glycerol-3-phosphate acyltransferase [Agitococcus lubricus]